MKFRLYFKGRFLSEHGDFLEAQAQARYSFFEFQSMAWEGSNTPPGFLILVPQIGPTSESQDNKVVCS